VLSAASVGGDVARSQSRVTVTLRGRGWWALHLRARCWSSWAAAPRAPSAPLHTKHSGRTNS